MPLSLEDVSCVYSPGTGYAVTALSDVTLTVEVGQTVLVVGETGSGKSTLLRLAAGLMKASAGTATIDGEPLTAKAARGRVGLVFQDAESQLFADTVRADVEFGPRNLGAGDEEALKVARDALQSVGLDPDTYGDRSPFALSGGEARRAAIAGVLAMNPRYVLADEPTSGLDASGRRAVGEVLIAACAHAGVVIVTHSPEEFLDVADAVVILSGGRCVWSGRTGELLAEPQVLVRAGLDVPGVLAVQDRLASAGVVIARPLLDPELAAGTIAAAMGGAS